MELKSAATASSAPEALSKTPSSPDGSLVIGSPAKIKRNLTWEEKIGIVENIKEYVSVAEEMWKQECYKQMSKIDEMRSGFETAYIDRAVASGSTYRLDLSNNYKKGKRFFHP